MDAGGDSPANARTQLLDLATKFNLLRNHFSAFMQGLATAADAAAARIALGATSTGIALFTATSVTTARTALGATATGVALFTASSVAAARTALGATALGGSLFTAASAADARSAIGSPPIGGSGATGTWPISITGAAAEQLYTNRSMGTAVVLGVHQFASPSTVVPLLVFRRTASVGYLWSFEVMGGVQVGSVYLGASSTTYA
ncbi:MAG: hypothetical protein EOO21_02330, partial [Comamonadaceae bacterium]